MKDIFRIGLLLLCLCPLQLFGQGTLSALGSMYSTSKGDTWESIAASHGLSVSELMAANPDLIGKKLKKGTFMMIPVPSTPPNVVPVVPSTSEETERTLIRTTISDLKVGVLLPFNNTKMVEFYRGLLMAADSVRQGGTNIDIYAWDCGVTEAQIKQLLPKLTEMDVVFGPASANQVQPVAELCRELGIRLVLPFNNGVSLQEYPLVYNAVAANSDVYEVATKNLMSQCAEKNYVFVHSSTADNNGRMLCEMLSKKLGRQNVTPRVVSLEGDDFAYEMAFNQVRNNVILLDDSGIRSLNILLANLKVFQQKHPDYHLSLVGYPEWQDETQRLLDDFFLFDTYIISPYYYNVLDTRTRHFQRSYEIAFRTLIAPTSPRYAALGFDIGFYFMKGISSLGDTFEQMQGSLQQEPYQSRFRFERDASGMSFSNKFVQFIHFSPEQRIELIR